MQITTDNVNKSAVSNLTTILQHDPENESLFRTCSVATNLVTSLKFNPIRSATMLCHFGQTRSSYVANFFILRGSTATNSATGVYVAVPERFGQNKEPAGSNEERIMKKPSFAHKSRFNRHNNNWNM